MDTQDQTARIRTLRAKGFSPKDIARALGVSPATAARLIRAIAIEQDANAAERELLACWVSPGWSVGLSVDGDPRWHDVPEADPDCAGLVAVLIARDAGRSRVSLCGYLVDVYCLGVKDVIGPRVMNTHQAADFTRFFFSAFPAPPLAAPLQLAHNLVYGAVEYASTLGFHPARGFEAARGHLGTSSGPCPITFGLDGKPYFIQGPNDDAARIVRELERSVGSDNFHYLIAV